jgi:hypothetical protein
MPQVGSTIAASCCQSSGSQKWSPGSRAGSLPRVIDFASLSSTPRAAQLNGKAQPRRRRPLRLGEIAQQW